MRAPNFVHAAIFACLLLATYPALPEEPKPTPENTISIKLTNEVKPQAFSRPIKFYIENVIDRSANPQPMLVYKPRGGVFLDRQPTEIVRQTLQEALQKSNLLADDRASTNYLLTVYLFHFGLDSGTGMEFFAKVELNVVVKDVATGKSQTVTAVGTSIQNQAFRKKSILKNVEANVDEALETSLRNLLRGTKLRDAVTSSDAAPAATPAATPSATPAATPTEPSRSSPQGRLDFRFGFTQFTAFVEI